MDGNVSGDVNAASFKPLSFEALLYVVDCRDAMRVPFFAPRVLIYCRLPTLALLTPPLFRSPDFQLERAGAAITRTVLVRRSVDRFTGLLFQRFLSV